MVSICIPTYNGVRWLRECIDSALACTVDCEILIVDDGSADATVATAREYAAKDARVKIFVNEKNLGLAGNWNRCLELAQGEWIKFLFQDDILGKDAIEKMLAAGENVDLVAARRDYLFGDYTTEEARAYYTDEVLTFDKLSRGKQFFSPAEIAHFAATHPARNFIGEPSTVMFRKSVVKRFGKFDEKLKQVCDLEYWLRISSEKGIAYVAEAEVQFRVHDASVSAQNAGGKKYASTFLDPIRLVYAQLYTEPYKNFRDSLTGSEMKKLLLWLRLRVYEAKKMATNAESEAALSEVFTEHPKLMELAGKRSNRAWYLLLGLKRKLR